MENSIERHNLICVVGKTCSGKDTLVNRLCQKHPNIFSPIISYTDRPMRDNEINGREHIFVSPEEFTTLYKNNHILTYTKICSELNPDGYRYMALINQLEKGNIYIIDPLGIKNLKKLHPEIELSVIYLHCPYEHREERARISRSDYDKFKKRCEQEETQFNDFQIKNEFDYLVYTGNELDKDRVFDFFEHLCFKILT